MAVPKNDELRDLLDGFVCVRQVQMWGVDLARFQFDYSMTWAIFFMNADGSIYGRYGSRSAVAKQSAREISLAGFRRSVEGALELHVRYEKDKDAATKEIAGKQPQHRPVWKTPEKIPALTKARPRLAVPFTKDARGHGGCIHCHMIPNHEMLSLRKRRKPIPDRKIWPYPMPDAVGMRMDPAQRATVRRVAEGSVAAKAGIEKGDEILRLDGQTILSTADIQWALHNTADSAKLGLAVLRDGQEKRLALQLEDGWRRKIGEWRFINLGVIMQIVGFNGRPLGKAQIARRGLNEDELALNVGRANRNRLRGVDLRRRDVIVEIDGKRDAMNLGQFTRYILGKAPGSTLELVRLRHGEERKVKVRLQ